MAHAKYLTCLWELADGTEARVVEHPQADATVSMLRSPVGASDDLPPPAPAPAVGEHTVEVLRDVLAYDAARIDALLASGAVAAPPP